MLIQILGTGCRYCKALLKNTELALERMQIHAHVESITDLEIIAEKGIMRTPGLLINNQVVSQGKVLAPIEIEALIQQAQTD